MDVPIGLFFVVLTKNLMMVTTLLLCLVVSLCFGHSELAIKSNFGCTNQKSYEFWIQQCMAVLLHNSINQCFVIPENKEWNQIIAWFLHLSTSLKYTS
jgi:hypothetical protein